jgi:hypothetical protein
MQFSLKDHIAPWYHGAIFSTMVLFCEIYPEKKWPPSINCQFLMTPYLFAPPSLEINNDWSLISIITYQNVVVKTNNNNNIIISIIIYNKKCWGDITLGKRNKIEKRYINVLLYGIICYCVYLVVLQDPKLWYDPYPFVSKSWVLSECRCQNQ